MNIGDDVPRCMTDEQRILQLETEVKRLTVALRTSNDLAERFERAWFVRGGEIERLQADCDAAASVERRRIFDAIQARIAASRDGAMAREVLRNTLQELAKS